MESVVVMGRVVNMGRVVVMGMGGCILLPFVYIIFSVQDKNIQMES